MLIKDVITLVTDRLAWLSYVHGSLAGTLANKIDSSRLSFKYLRDAENLAEHVLEIPDGFRLLERG